MVANEFHGRQFECSQFVPAYPNLSGDSFICAVRGSAPGERTVSGDNYIYSQYQYTYDHEWRNFGILMASWIFFTVLYLVTTEINSATSSKAEYLVFRRGHIPAHMRDTDKSQGDTPPANTALAEKPAELEPNISVIPEQHSIFTWRNVCYDIPVKGGQRRLLDSVSGWVKPGTLTALMGVSGAGKTTLLDVLAKRVSIGVVTGDMLVGGRPLDSSFQRKTGYVQQQDLHLPTTTVREALRFSALLRQPKAVSKKEKYNYVEEVIETLNMQDFADAIVGNPGEGLNVEQRKLLTIGVEMAAKPALLIFLDEPTSGLDSQSSWSICSFLRKLADRGQAVLSTIHQPSAVLFQEFDRLLFLAKGGRTVYFAEIGQESRTLLDYFEANVARPCGATENPAEYILEIIGAGASGKSSQDWPSVWNESPEAREVQNEIDRIHQDRASAPSEEEKNAHQEYAMPFVYQLWHVTHRVFQQYWREPIYVWAKLILATASAIFIGFTFFKPNSSQQRFQDVLFSAFMLTSIFSTLVQQIMPKFVVQRSLHEVRERPSKAYSWAAFIMANVAVEIPWQILAGILSWAGYYFAVYGANQGPPPPGPNAPLHHPILNLHLDLRKPRHLRPPRRRNRRHNRNPHVHDDPRLQRRHAAPQRPPGLLDLHVPRLPSHLPHRGSHLNGVTRTRDRVRKRGIERLQPAHRPGLRRIHGCLSSACSGEIVQPGRDTGLPVLLSPGRGPVPRRFEHLERWRNWGVGWAYVGFNIMGTVMLYYIFRVRHWNPTTLVRNIKQGAKVVCRVFKRRSGTTPWGKEADNGRLY